MVPLILAVGVLAIPQASDGVYRAPDLRTGVAQSGQIYLQILVTPERTVQSCDVIYSDFSERVGARACERLREQQFEEAATDVDGHPTYGVYVLVSSRISGVSVGSSRAGRLLQDPPPSPFLPDIVVSVRNLPAAFGTEKLVAVLAQVDTAGALTACEAKDGAPTSLAEVACQQLGSFEFPTVSDRMGQPVSYVREVHVNFVEESG